MNIIFDINKLLQLLKDFHLVTKLRVGVYDCNYREILSYPMGHSNLCRIIRVPSKWLHRCKDCDREAFAYARNYDGAYVYRCHAGLIEATVSIRNEGRTIGYLMFGQMRYKEDMPMGWIYSQEVLKFLGVTSDYLMEAFHNLPSIETKRIHAYARILQACAEFAMLDGYVQIRRSKLPESLENYINNNLQNSLSLKELTHELGVGKTTLCTHAKKHFGMSIGSLIRKMRITKAKKLLKQTDSSISSIAEKVGIADYNYFSKVFKGETGLTPTAYRKSY